MTAFSADCQVSKSEAPIHGLFLKLAVILDPRPLSNSAPHPHLLPFLSSKPPPPLIEDPPGFDRQSVLDPSFRFAPVFDKTAQGERDVVTLKMGAPRGVSDVVSLSEMNTMI